VLIRGKFCLSITGSPDHARSPDLVPPDPRLSALISGKVLFCFSDHQITRSRAITRSPNIFPIIVGRRLRSYPIKPLRAPLFSCAQQGWARQGHFPVEGVGLAAATGGFMLRGADIRFEWRLDLDRVGVGVGVGAAFSKCK
jgi:hypothetical protein